MDLYKLSTKESKKLFKDEDLDFLKDVHLIKVTKNYKHKFQED